MKFIADENFPGLAVKVLREAGFDVAWVSEIDRGANDDKVLARCVTCVRIRSLPADPRENRASATLPP